MTGRLQDDRDGDGPRGAPKRFRLTEAVRPAAAARNMPRQGYRFDDYADPETSLRVPVLAAAVSGERLFDTFLSLLEPLGPLVDVVLETSHDGGLDHIDLVREGIDLPVLLSHFCDFEDLLVNDGCTGVAVIAANRPIEVQFDEHKLLMVYAGCRLTPFRRILHRAGVRRTDRMKFITEGEHLHATHPRHRAAFQQLCYRLGVREPVGQVNW